MAMPVEERSAPILDMLAQTARQDDDAPAPLGPDIYASPEILELELDTVFRKEWTCVGRVDEFRKPGDYVAITHGRIPIVAIMQSSGEITAMLNICAHRMAPLVNGRGNTPRFVCPYHAWSYDREGRLLAAPRMPKDFDTSQCTLHRAQVETWMGFVFVNPDPDAPSLVETLGALDALFRPYPLARMKTMQHIQFEWNCNWKIAVENFIESYHFEMVHAATLAEFSPQETLRMTAEGDNYAFHEFVWPEGSVERMEGSLLLDNPDITDEQERTVYFGGVFPNHMFTVQYDQIAWMRMQPLAVDRTLIDFGIAGFFDIPEGVEPDPTHPEFHYLRLAGEINEEDRAIVEGIQRNVSSRMGWPSRLHPAEHGILTFARYLDRQLHGRNRAAA